MQFRVLFCSLWSSCNTTMYIISESLYSNDVELDMCKLSHTLAALLMFFYKDHTCLIELLKVFAVVWQKLNIKIEYVGSMEEFLVYYFSKYELIWLYLCVFMPFSVAWVVVNKGNIILIVYIHIEGDTQVF